MHTCSRRTKKLVQSGQHRCIIPRSFKRDNKKIGKCEYNGGEHPIHADYNMIMMTPDNCFGTK